MEDVAEMKAAGMDWLTLNVGDGHSWGDWQIVINRARAQGLHVFPWMRCRTLFECRSLLRQADEVGFEAILNIEDEFKDVTPPNEVKVVIDEFPDLNVGISTIGWMYNDVNFHPLADTPFLLQLFPADMRFDPALLEQKQKDCVKHARDHGITYVGMTYQTYGQAEPEWYAYWKGVKSFYTADDIGAGNWAAWS